jgi:ketosteroid isomerase-like protein
MSQENVEIVEQMVTAWNRGDHDAARDFFDPDVEVEAALGADIDGKYFGHAGLAELMRFWGAFGSFRSDIEKCISAGDVVVMLFRHRGTGKRSGIDVELRNWHVFTVRNGKIVRHGHFSTEAQALEAAGPSGLGK